MSLKAKPSTSKPTTLSKPKAVKLTASKATKK